MTAHASVLPSPRLHEMPPSGSEPTTLAELTREVGRIAGDRVARIRQITAQARRTTPEATLRRIDALLACRTAMEGNVAPLLAVEAMLLSLVEADR